MHKCCLHLIFRTAHRVIRTRDRDDLLAFYIFRGVLSDLAVSLQSHERRLREQLKIGQRIEILLMDDCGPLGLDPHADAGTGKFCRFQRHETYIRSVQDLHYSGDHAFFFDSRLDIPEYFVQRNVTDRSLDLSLERGAHADHDLLWVCPLLSAGVT